LIYALVKIFKEKQHAQSFINGELYMQTLRDYKDWIDDNGELRGDPCEGIVGYFQSDDIQLEIGNIKLDSDSFDGAVLVHSNDLLSRNAFCTYALNSRGFDKISVDTLKEFKNILEVHSKCYGLGSYCVAITNVSEFISRTKSAIKSINVDGAISLVDYFDDQIFSGELDSDMHGFQKRKTFEHQREHRILIDLNYKIPEKYTLNVGDLSDITTEILTPQELNEILEVRLPDGSKA
jgi:hypothetical protein